MLLCPHLFFYLGTRPANVGRGAVNRDSCYNPPSCNGLPGSPHAQKRRRRRERAIRRGAFLAAGNRLATPHCYPPRCRGGICGRGATVAHQPSKLRTRVRFPSSAPDQTVGNQLHSFGRCSGRLRHATSARRDDVLRLPGCKLGHNLVLENDQ